MNKVQCPNCLAFDTEQLGFTTACQEVHCLGFALLFWLIVPVSVIYGIVMAIRDTATFECRKCKYEWSVKKPKQ